MERLGQLVSWLLSVAVPVASLLSVMRWLPQPFGELGLISDVLLLIVAVVFLHGMVLIASEGIWD